MSKRAILITLISVGALTLTNIIFFVLYLPRLSKTEVSKPAGSGPLIAPPSPSTTTPAVSRVAPADGTMVQRVESSQGGNIRIKYVRTKGSAVRQIVLESVKVPAESKTFFEFQRNAWILISPNDEWIALNNRPSAGHSDLQLYHHDGPGSLDYVIPEELKSPDGQIDQIVWQYYLHELGLPADTAREDVSIDAVGWDAESKKLAVTVAVSQADADDKVPPPWNCVIDIASKEIDVTPEAAQAFNGQQGQPPTGSPGAPPGSSPAGQVGGGTPLQGEFPGEKFPATRSGVLTTDTISEWSSSDVRYAIGEIYARRGADFSDDSTNRKRFSKMAWYKARPGVTKDQIKAELSDVEKQNLDLLEKRASRVSSSSHARSTPPQKFGEKIKKFFQGGH
jgi:hypothetical protein